MNITRHQADLLNKALQKLSSFVMYYGDDEAEVLLRELSKSFETSTENIVKKAIVIEVENKEDALVHAKYWRTRKFLDVRKGRTVVELELLGGLAYAPDSYIISLFNQRGVNCDEDMDVNEHVVHARYLAEKLIGSVKVIPIN
ncbi:hypothetical protein ACI2KR_06970 [Pseudomonas luteola]